MDFLYELFYSFLLFFPSFPSFLFLFYFLFFFSFLILFSLHFLFSFGIFSPIWIVIDRIGQEEEISSSFPHTTCVVHELSPYSLIYLFLFYDITFHVANCEPHIQVHHMALPSVTLLGCHLASPNCTMCHPTPHASQNVKPRLPRNPMKFDVVARFCETISTEKSASSSEI